MLGNFDLYQGLFNIVVRRPLERIERKRDTFNYFQQQFDTSTVFRS